MERHAVFIGYRQEDSADVAGRAYDRLRKSFGSDSVFRDVDALPVGQDFGSYIFGVLSRCRVFLAFIGPTWLDARDAEGRRRIDDPSDWVRIEIETAFRTPRLQVIPVLVDGASMPRLEDLPQSLRPICRLNAAAVRRDPDFHRDMDRLIAALEADQIPSVDRAGVPARAPKRTVIALAILAALTLALLGFGALRLFAPGSRTTGTAEPPGSSGSQAPNAQIRREPPDTDVISSEAPTVTPIEPDVSAVSPPSTDTSTEVGTGTGAEQVFNDCNSAGWCPTMVLVPAGSFIMGSPDNEEGHLSNEGPQHRVRLRSFAVGKFEITFNQWQVCVDREGCHNREPNDFGWGRGNRPVLDVSWSDAQEYVRWLSGATGKNYRLLSEAEWEYAARARTATAFSFGDRVSRQVVGLNVSATSPVGSYPANAFGLHDMHGNVFEWIQDCYNDSYDGAPSDGSPWLSGDCQVRMIRGGSWRYPPVGEMRSAFRGRSNNRTRNAQTAGPDSIGFRVARDLD